MVAASPCVDADRCPPGSNWWHRENFPLSGEQWNSQRQGFFLLHHEPERWHLIFKGVATENGYMGDPINASRAEQIARAFRPLLSFAQVHTAAFCDDAGPCRDCDAPYYYHHWHVSEGGYGYCPRGHGKSMDPHR